MTLLNILFTKNFFFIVMRVERGSLVKTMNEDQLFNSSIYLVLLVKKRKGYKMKVSVKIRGWI